MQVILVIKQAEGKVFSQAGAVLSVWASQWSNRNSKQLTGDGNLVRIEAPKRGSQGRWIGNLREHGSPWFCFMKFPLNSVSFDTYMSKESVVRFKNPNPDPQLESLSHICSSNLENIFLYVAFVTLFEALPTCTEHCPPPSDQVGL